VVISNFFAEAPFASTKESAATNAARAADPAIIVPFEG
jgi:hypothetical protein